jgi:hypothetical protein
MLASFEQDKKQKPVVQLATYLVGTYGVEPALAMLERAVQIHPEGAELLDITGTILMEAVRPRRHG